MLRLVIGTAALGLATASTPLRRGLADPLPEDQKTQSSKNLVGQFQVVGAVCYDENMQGTDEVVISEWRRHKTPPRLLSVFWRQCRPAFRRAALSPKSPWTPSRRPPYTVF